VQKPKLQAERLCTNFATAAVMRPYATGRRPDVPTWCHRCDCDWASPCRAESVNHSPTSLPTA